jgi:hypothetical protein
LTICKYTQNSERLQNLRERYRSKDLCLFKGAAILFYEKRMNSTEDPEEPEISKSEVLGFGIQTCTLPRSYIMRRNDLYWFLCIVFIV